jgi:two-component system, chemotaxis family, protein-glutamate methylesterase/glutaminase
VQDPAEALYPTMPENALAATNGEAEVLSLHAIAARIRELTTVELTDLEVRMSDDVRMPDQPEDGRDLVEADQDEVERLTRSGTPSGYTCPECHGALWEIPDRSLLRFRCRVGHAYSAETLCDEQDRFLESALWTALRALEENAGFAGRLLARARQRGHTLAADRFARKVRSLEAQQQTIRTVLDARTQQAVPADLPSELLDHSEVAGLTADER